MAKAPAQKWRAAHLPEQPRQALGTCGTALGHECIKLVGQVLQNCPGLENTYRCVTAVVKQGWYFGVGVGRNKATTKLVTLVNFYQPRVILCAGMPQF